MAYKEISVLVGGALEQTEIFSYDDILEVAKCYGFIAETQKEALESSERVELFEMTHEHEPDVDCECAQYVTDHNPFWTNGKE